MSAVLFAEFAQVERLLAAARQIDRASDRVLDAFTPFPVPQLDELLTQDRFRSRIVLAMVVGGLSFAAIAFALQWYSAVVSYPLNVGGRPLDSWPVFLLVPFEVGCLRRPYQASWSFSSNADCRACTIRFSLCQGSNGRARIDSSCWWRRPQPR